MDQTLKQKLRALPRAAWILYAGTFINRSATFVVVFLVLYLTRRGYSVQQAGIALGAYGLGNLISAALGGYLADRIGRRKTIALSMFSVAGALTLLSQAEQLGPIIVLSALTGLTGDLYRAAASALLADLVPTGQRLIAFTMYRLFLNAGIAIGPAIAGFLAEQSFIYLFVADAVTSVIYGLIAIVALPEGRRTSKEEARWSIAFKTIAHDRRFLLFLAASAAITFVFFQFESTFPLHVRDAGFSTAVYGLLISLNGLLIILIELPLTGITQRYSPSRVIAVGYLLVGAGFAVNLVAHTIPLLVIAVVIWTFGEMASAPVSVAYVADLAPENVRGRYMGIYGLTWSLGLMLGPSLGAFVFAESPALLWSLCGVLGVLTAWLVLGSEDRQQQSQADHRQATDHVEP